MLIDNKDINAQAELKENKNVKVDNTVFKVLISYLNDYSKVVDLIIKDVYNDLSKITNVCNLELLNYLENDEKKDLDKTLSTLLSPYFLTIYFRSLIIPNYNSKDYIGLGKDKFTEFMTLFLQNLIGFNPNDKFIEVNKLYYNKFQTILTEDVRIKKEFINNPLFEKHIIQDKIIYLNKKLYEQYSQEYIKNYLFNLILTIGNTNSSKIPTLSTLYQNFDTVLNYKLLNNFSELKDKGILSKMELSSGGIKSIESIYTQYCEFLARFDKNVDSIPLLITKDSFLTKKSFLENFQIETDQIKFNADDTHKYVSKLNTKFLSELNKGLTEKQALKTVLDIKNLNKNLIKIVDKEVVKINLDKINDKTALYFLLKSQVNFNNQDLGYFNNNPQHLSDFISEKILNEDLKTSFKDTSYFKYIENGKIVPIGIYVDGISQIVNKYIYQYLCPIVDSQRDALYLQDIENQISWFRTWASSATSRINFNLVGLTHLGCILQFNFKQYLMAIHKFLYAYQNAGGNKPPEYRLLLKELMQLIQDPNNDRLIEGFINKKALINECSNGFDDSTINIKINLNNPVNSIKYFGRKSFKLDIYDKAKATGNLKIYLQSFKYDAGYHKFNLDYSSEALKSKGVKTPIKIINLTEPVEEIDLKFCLTDFELEYTLPGFYEINITSKKSAKKPKIKLGKNVITRVDTEFCKKNTVLAVIPKVEIPVYLAYNSGEPKNKNCKYIGVSYVDNGEEIKFFIEQSNVKNYVTKKAVKKTVKAKK